MSKTCEGPECERPHYGGGWCVGHYAQVRRGRPLTPLRAKRKRVRERVREDGYVWCSKCQAYKPTNEFHKDANDKSGCTSHCRECVAAYGLTHKFGLSRADYDRMLESQDGVCRICRKTPEENGKALAVDHDRACCPGNKSCGKCVRSLLCGNCNRAIGYFKDDPSLILAALTYVMEFHPDNPARQATAA